MIGSTFNFSEIFLKSNAMHPGLDVVIAQVVGALTASPMLNSPNVSLINSMDFIDERI